MSASASTEPNDTIPSAHVLGAAIVHALHQAWIPVSAVRTRASERLGLGPYGLPTPLVEVVLDDLVAAGLVVSEPIAADPGVRRFRNASWPS